jgi:hypothetical protein
MAKDHLSVRVELGGLIGGLQRSIQRCVGLVSFGLLAMENTTDGELELPGAYFQLAIAGDEHRRFAAVKEDFQTWILTGGLRDSVEAVSVSLEQARSVCAVWSFAPGADITGQEWNERMVTEARKFHRLGLPHKIGFLKDEYDPRLAPDLTEHLLSINRARNCLVHRRGIVSDLDVNSPDGLLVRWLKMELLIEGPSGQRSVIPPARAEAGETVSLRQAETTKLFRVGERVAFDAQEFSELCWTFFRFGQQLVSNLEAYGRARGVPFTEPGAPSAPPAS